MSAVDQSLASDEKVLLRTRPHAIVMMPIAVTELVAVGILAYVKIVTGTTAAWWLVAVAAVLLAGAVGIIAVQLYRASNEYAITDRRIIVVRGLIARHVDDTVLSKIETVAVHQGISGRMFNFGDIVFTGTGGSSTRLALVPDPLGFRRLLHGRSEIPRQELVGAGS